MKQVNVGNDGSVKIKSIVASEGIALPTATRVRKSEGAMYPFNTMKVGSSFPVVNQKAASAATQAFKSEIYAEARKVGRLVTRSLKKYPELREAHNVVLDENAYGVWMMEPKAEGAE
jgi:hypothetical protein